MIRSFWKAGAPAFALFCTIDISIKRVIIRIGSIGIIIHDTVISSLPNCSVCFVLRRTCFLLIDVIIYVIGLCGYTKRSLIKSHFSWCIVSRFDPNYLQYVFFFKLRKTHKDVVGTCLTYQTKAHYITLLMGYNT